MDNTKPTLMNALGELVYLRPLILVVPMTLAGLLAAGPFRLGRALLTVAIIVVADLGANIINNYSDWDIDRMNGKRAALHAVFTKGSLIGVYLGTLAVLGGVLLALSANALLIASSAGFALLGALYSVGPKLKDRTPWNYAAIAVAYAGLAFYIGLFSQSGSLELLVSWLPVVAAVVLFDFGYCITKDYVDYEGDRHFGKRTLPVLLGKRKSLAVQAAVICAAYLLLAAALVFDWIPPVYSAFYLSFVVAVYMLHKAGASDEHDELKKAFYIAGYNGMFVRVILIGAVIVGASPAMMVADGSSGSVDGSHAHRSHESAPLWRPMVGG
jgi:geranylgeranylglycerol-phosphate geranylgeranyltransferase